MFHFGFVGEEIRTNLFSVAIKPRSRLGVQPTLKCIPLTFCMVLENLFEDLKLLRNPKIFSILCSAPSTYATPILWLSKKI